MANQVKAWTYTSAGYPQCLKFKTIDALSPQDVQPNHILVKIKAAGLNPVDIQLMNLFVWNIPLQMFNTEKVSSSDFSGTIVAAASGTGFKEGDEVFGINMAPWKSCSGTLSEVAHIDLASACVVKRPSALGATQTAGLGCAWLTAKTSVELVAPYVEPTNSKRVAILGGSSATGIYSIICAKRKGWKVLTTSSGRNKDFVTDTLGADEHVDYTKQSVREFVARFKPDAIIDCVGGTECIGINSTKYYLTIVGDKTGRTTMGGPLTYFISFALKQWIRWGLGRAGLGARYDVIALDLKKEYLEEAAKLKPEQCFVDSVFAFEDAMKAFERLNTGRARGKVVVEVSK